VFQVNLPIPYLQSPISLLSPPIPRRLRLRPAKLGDICPDSPVPFPFPVRRPIAKLEAVWPWT